MTYRMQIYIFLNEKFTYSKWKGNRKYQERLVALIHSFSFFLNANIMINMHIAPIDASPILIRTFCHHVIGFSTSRITSTG